MVRKLIILFLFAVFLSGCNSISKTSVSNDLFILTIKQKYEQGTQQVTQSEHVTEGQFDDWEWIDEDGTMWRINRLKENKQTE